MKAEEQSSESSTSEGQFHDIEKKLEKYKFKREAHQGGIIGYSKKGANYGPLNNLSCLPEEALEILEVQLQSNIIPLKEHFGYTAPSIGFFELPLRRIGAISRMFAPMLKSLQPEVRGDCKHSLGRQMFSVEPQESQYITRAVNAIHVADPGGSGCLEVSWASPCGVLWGIPNGRPYDFESPRGSRFRSFLSLKIELENVKESAAFEDSCMELANSFLYELSTRNGVSLEPIRFAEYAPALRPSGSPLLEKVRFPETRVKPEVAELFSFALGARENPSLSFLAYYQILEYFFPYAVRREAMRKVRKEISDPRFSKGEDSSILKILSAAEAISSASESKQIATLIADSVRLEVLTGFFLDDPWGKHFTNDGPISAAGSINLKNTTKSLPVQVAERVYKIRNRIVHAKDDPKYADVRVLLPKGEEAYSLRPDIALLRLLAEEVVIDAQV